MTEELTSYLLQHKSLSIPGLGSMYIERIPAQTDFVNKRILPPSFHYRFDKYFDAPDKDFFTYLAQQKKMADYEAIKWYNEWAYELRNKLREGHEVEWKGIGTLKQDHSGDVVFQSAGAISTHLEPATAVRVLRGRVQQTMLVGDQEVTKEIVTEDGREYISDEAYVEKESWWIYALIIAAIALSVIFFHFYRNGFTPSSSGNQQTIDSSN